MCYVGELGTFVRYLTRLMLGTDGEQLFFGAEGPVSGHWPDRAFVSLHKRKINTSTRGVELELLSHSPSAPLAGIMDLTGARHIILW